MEREINCNCECSCQCKCRYHIEDREIKENQIYTFPEVMFLTGLGEKSTLKLLNDSRCNSADIGNGWRILGSEIIAYFKVRRIKEFDKYWSGRGKVNGKEGKQRKGYI